MSLVFKSNDFYSGSSVIPTMAQVTTTQAAVYSKFIARVQADGGVIVSTAKIQEAISFLFDNNLYGRMGVCASPHYAKKLDAQGGILKLYSLDGIDLVGLTIGGGALPKITGDNFIDFNEGVNADTVGGILTTETKNAWSLTGRFAFALATKDSVNNPNNYFAGFSQHNDTTLNTPIFSLLSAAGAYTSRINESVYGGTSLQIAYASHGLVNRGVVVTAFDKRAALFNQLCINLVVDSKAAPSVPSKIWEDKHYIDFGGISLSTTKTVAGIKASALWFLSDLTQAQQIAVNQFLTQRYL